MKEITLEEAKKVMEDFPNEEHYIQVRFQQFLTMGEYDDNTIETSNYWNRCRKMVVIHNAFDGREGVEIANEILKQPIKKK